MGRVLNLTFVCGFGLELGSIIGMSLWPEIEYTAIPLAVIGAFMMTLALSANLKT